MLFTVKQTDFHNSHHFDIEPLIDGGGLSLSIYKHFVNSSRVVFVQAQLSTSNECHVSFETSSVEFSRHFDKSAETY